MTNPNVKWSDIKGLSTAKKLLHEAIVLPTKYPELFTGLCTPWTAMLFYGPPGTGIHKKNLILLMSRPLILFNTIRK